MIRYLYIIGLVIGCMDFPVQAKGIMPSAGAPQTNTNTRKTDTKSTASTSDKAKAKKVTASSSEVKKDTSSRTAAKTSESSSLAKASSNTSAANRAKTSTAITRASNKPSSSSRPASTSIASAHAYSSSSATTPTNHSVSGGRLARVTAYWAGEGDYYTGKCLSSTGIHLHDGHCAVDPRIIPYGSTVEIAGVGTYLAVDTGSAVISREAAKEAGHNQAEREALVVDLFFEHRRDGERFAAGATKWAQITWTAPRSTASTQDTRSSAAE